MSLYLDANAGVPATPAGLRAYAEAAALWGNPSSSHAAGRAAAASLATSRARVAEVLSVAPAEVVFTSGATEANALALLGVVGAADPSAAALSGGPAHVVTTAVEHPSVLDTLRTQAAAGRVDLTVVAPQPDGQVRAEDVIGALRPATRLVAMVAACSETGVLQPVVAVGAALADHGAVFHVDAVQALGRVPVQPRTWGADLVSLSGHKVGAVGGIGALVVRPGLTLGPQLVGGGQEHGLRASTENVAGAASFAAALAELPASEGPPPDAVTALADQRRRLEDGLRQAATACGVTLRVLGAAAPRLPNTTCIHLAGCPGEALMMALDARGIEISTGSACTSGSVEPSPILLAMGLDPATAKQTVRFSLPWGLTPHHIDQAISATAEVLAQLVQAPV